MNGGGECTTETFTDITAFQVRDDLGSTPGGDVSIQVI
jgi:hypothetical protein